MYLLTVMHCYICILTIMKLQHVSYVSKALCLTCSVPGWLFKIIFWLGYCNFMMNSIIYTCSSREFKRAFIRILRRQFRWGDSGRKTECRGLDREERPGKERKEDRGGCIKLSSLYCKSTNFGVLLYLANLANCVFSLIFVAANIYVDRTLHRRATERRQI